MNIELLRFYAGLALVLAAFIGYIVVVYAGKPGKWYMNDIGLYMLLIGAALLGVNIPAVLQPSTPP